MGITTLTGLWGLGRTKGGGVLTVGEEGRTELNFSVAVPADGKGGFAEGLEGWECGGVGVTAILGERDGEEVEVVMETVVLGALFWTGLSGGTVIEEVTIGSVTVLTMATTGVAPPPVGTIQYEAHSFTLRTSIYNIFFFKYLMSPG